MTEKSSGWYWVDYSDFIEVLPLKDSKPHYKGDECWCNPHVAYARDAVPLITHNSADGREIKEREQHGHPTKRT